MSESSCSSPEASGRPGELRRQLWDPDPVLRGQAAEALGQVGDRAAVSDLRRLLDDRDGVVAFKAALALAWLGDDSGVPVLLWALSNRDLCFLALQALADLGSPRALPELKRFFSRRFLHVLERLQASAALHRAGDSEGTTYLRGRLGSSHPEERGLALELWGRLKMPDALDLLLGVASDPQDAQRLDAVRGLLQLGDRRALELLDRIAADPSDPELAELAGEAAAVLREDPER